MRFRIIASILALSVAGIASADPILFTYTGSGSGSVGSTAFTNAAFTISATGDTTARESFSAGYFINHVTTTIDISGVGAFTFLTATRTFVNNSVAVLGFSRAGANGNDLYNGPFSGLGAPWDMLSDLGPIAGTFGLLQWSLTNVDTNGGVLVFANSSGPGTFSATLNVPEPSTIWLMLAGFCVLAVMMRRSIKST